MSNIPPLFGHQAETVELLEREPFVFDMSDPGTGKTRAALEAFARRRRGSGGKALVIAPKSILQLAWGNDIDKFIPGLTYVCAFAQNRIEMLTQWDVDVYITNHDAPRYLAKQLPKNFWEKNGFDTLIIDESTAFKHRTSARSKAVAKMAKQFEYRELMSGTPNPNGVTDLWHQAFILDEGKHLGDSFFRFRQSVCDPVQVGPSRDHVKWTDKPGVEEVVIGLLEDISIRHDFNECTDIPPNVTRAYFYELPAKARRIYNEMKSTSVAILDDQKSFRTLTAVHAGSVSQKLLQIASGAVYTGEEDGKYELIETGRYELVMDLVEERQHSLVVFNWRHQRDLLCKMAAARGISFAFIDGSVPDSQRLKIVNEFEDGAYQALFIHPQTAAHGLTLVRGQATIWASPTYNAEHYKQVYHRIVRTGQKQKTETIHIIAPGTIDELVYERLEGKLSAMALLLELAKD